MKNTMTKTEYILANLCAFLYFAVLYNRFLFRVIPGCSLSRSGIIMSALIFLVMIFGFVLTFSGHRNGTNVVVNNGLPLELYTLLVFHADYPVFTAIAAGMTLLYCALYIYFCILRPVHSASGRKKNMLKKILQGLRNIMTAAALSLLILMVPVILNTAFDSTTQNSGDPSTDASGCTIEENIDTLEILYKDSWYEMSTDEKTEILQIVADIETCYLGLPYELHVAVDYLDVSTAAQYNKEIHTIILNKIFLNGTYAEEMLDSVCHECRHAYQHCLCSMYDSVDDKYRNLLSVREIQEFQDEFRNYESGTEDFSDYYDQKCETDARTYAEERTKYYHEKLN